MHTSTNALSHRTALPRKRPPPPPPLVDLLAMRLMPLTLLYLPWVDFGSRGRLHATALRPCRVANPIDALVPRVFTKFQAGLFYHTSLASFLAEIKVFEWRCCGRIPMVQLARECELL